MLADKAFPDDHPYGICFCIDSSDSDAVEQIVGDYGLDSDRRVNRQCVQHEAIVQYDCTDLGFYCFQNGSEWPVLLLSSRKIICEAPDFSVADTVLDAVFRILPCWNLMLIWINQFQGNLKVYLGLLPIRRLPQLMRRNQFEENGNLSSSDLESVFKYFGI